MRRALLALLLIVFSTLVGLAMAEAVLRIGGFHEPIWFGPDRELGGALRPKVSGWHTSEGHAWVAINSAGQRDWEHAIEKPPNVYRIAVIGDSYAEAMQVDIKDAFWHVLEEKLSQCSFRPGMKIEVVNFGESGYSTAQEYLVLQSRAARYRPDMVLLAFTNGNDVRNNSKALEPEKDRPFFIAGPSGLILDNSFRDTDTFRQRSSAMLEFYRELADHSRVMQLVHVARNALSQWRETSSAAPAAAAPAAEPGLDYATLAPPRTHAWEDAWTVTEALINRISHYASAHGTPLVIVPVTAASQVDPDRHAREELQRSLGVSDLFYIEHRLQLLAQSNGARFIPLAYEMQKRAEAEHIYFHGFKNVGMGKGHWNENGHRAAAEIIARDLCTRPPANPAAVPSGS